MELSSSNYESSLLAIPFYATGLLILHNSTVHRMDLHKQQCTGKQINKQELLESDKIN